MAIIGLGLHFLITIGAAAIYYLVAKRQGWLVRHPFLSGLVFGTLFFLALNYVILPLSVIGHPLYVRRGDDRDCAAESYHHDRPPNLFDFRLATEDRTALSATGYRRAR